MHQSHQYAQLVGYVIRPQGTLNNIFKKIQQIFLAQKIWAKTEESNFGRYYLSKVMYKAKNHVNKS